MIRSKVDHSIFKTSMTVDISASKIVLHVLD